MENIEIKSKFRSSHIDRTGGIDLEPDFRPYTMDFKGKKSTNSFSRQQISVFATKVREVCLNKCLCPIEMKQKSQDGERESTVLYWGIADFKGINYWLLIQQNVYFNPHFYLNHELKEDYTILYREKDYPSFTKICEFKENSHCILEDVNTFKILQKEFPFLKSLTI